MLHFVSFNTMLWFLSCWDKIRPNWKIHITVIRLQYIHLKSIKRNLGKDTLQVGDLSSCYFFVVSSNDVILVLLQSPFSFFYRKRNRKTNISLPDSVYYFFACAFCIHGGVNKSIERRIIRIFSFFDSQSHTLLNHEFTKLISVCGHSS